MKIVKKIILLSLCTILNLNCTKCYALDEIGGLNELKNAIAGPDLTNNFTQNQSIILNANLNAITKANSVLNIYGDTINGHTMSGELVGVATYSGFRVSSGQTLQINPANGSTDILATFEKFYRATAGGAINNTGSIGISNSQFTGNISNTDGGAIYILNTTDTLTSVITNSIFDGNHATNNGGAIYKQKGTLIIDNSSFLENYTSTRDGGAIYATSGTLTITNGSLFSKNWAFRHGGAIYNSGANLNVDGSIFSENHSDNWYGGAVYSYNAAPTLTASFTNSEFRKNHSENAGGAIYNYVGQLDINHTTFSENYVVNGFGGAVSNSQGTLNITNNSSFEKNHAYAEGGAIYNILAPINVSDSNFSENYSENASGGAIYNSGDKLTIDHSTFSKNHAYGAGGAIKNAYSDIEIKNGTSFTENYSDNNLGGAIANEGT